MKRSTYFLLAAIFMSLIGSGCASKQPSFGESVKSEGMAVAGIGEKWEQGQALIRKGNKQIRKGNKLINEGQEDVAEGKAKVKTGQKLIDEAEKAYEASSNRNSAN